MPCSDLNYAVLRHAGSDESASLVESLPGLPFEHRPSPMANGAGSLQEFVNLLRLEPAPHLHRAVAEAMTIHETSFFRDVRPFDALRQTIIPALIAQNQAKRRLHIWSAACSTGQEAYSIAMLLLEHFPQLADWDVKIVGSDVSQFVLDAARHARYRRMEVNRGLPVRLLVKYFTRVGDEWQLQSRVRELCEFREANLCAPLPPLPVFDLVLLRNVLLYFSHTDRSSVFARVRRQMNPQGFLLLGNAEQAEDSTDRFSTEFAADYLFYRPATHRPVTCSSCPDARPASFPPD